MGHPLSPVAAGGQLLSKDAQMRTVPVSHRRQRFGKFPKYGQSSPARLEQAGGVLVGERVGQAMDVPRCVPIVEGGVGRAVAFVPVFAGGSVGSESSLAAPCIRQTRTRTRTRTNHLLFQTIFVVDAAEPFGLYLLQWWQRGASCR
jgi:hypothetical protein